MTIGLVILGIVSLLIFFGLIGGTLNALKTVSWVAFLAILAFAVCAMIPDIKIGGMFTMSVAAFVLPFSAMIILGFMTGGGAEFMRAVAAQFLVGALSVLLFLYLPSGGVFPIVNSVIIGFSAGAAAFIAGRTPIATLYGVMGGLVIGVTAAALINYYAYGAAAIVMADSHTFDAVIIASIFGVLLSRFADRLSGKNSDRFKRRTALNTEAGKDQNFKGTKPEDFDDYFDDQG